MAGVKTSKEALFAACFARKGGASALRKLVATQRSSPSLFSLQRDSKHSSSSSPPFLPTATVLAEIVNPKLKL